MSSERHRVRSRPRAGFAPRGWGFSVLRRAACLALASAILLGAMRASGGQLKVEVVRLSISRETAAADARVYDNQRKVVGTVPKGAEVEVLETKGSWYRIRYAPEKGKPIEGWALAKHFAEQEETLVEAVRETPILSERRREIGTIPEGERAELLEIQDLHLLVRYTLADGKSVEGLVRKTDMIEAPAADFARKVKETLDGSVQVMRSAGFERRQTKTFGKQKTLVEIVSRRETLWLQIVLASKVPVSGLQIRYQFYKEVSGVAGKGQIVKGEGGAVAVRGAVGERPSTFKSQFTRYEWEDQVIDPDKPEVERANLPDYLVGERFHGYRAEVYWRGVLLKTFEENALPKE